MKTLESTIEGACDDCKEGTLEEEAALGADDLVGVVEAILVGGCGDCKDGWMLDSLLGGALGSADSVGSLEPSKDGD